MKHGNNGNGNGNGNNDGGSFFDFAEDLVIPEEVDGFSSKDRAEKVLTDLLIKNELFESEGSSDASTGSFRKRPARYEHPLWSLGWTDGRLGQPSETNEALLLARGKLRRERRIQALKAKLSLNEAKLPDLDLKITRLRELLNEALIHFKNIGTDRAGRFHEFSSVLGGFYIFVAIILFLSDIPLTLKLVAKGFDLTTEVKGSETGRTLYGIEQLFRLPWAQLSDFWEPLTLALGIAMMGVFIKIFLDDIFFRQTEEVRWPRIVVLCVICACFIGTIVVLGLFRSETQKRISHNELVQKRLAMTEKMKGLNISEAERQSWLNELNAEPESAWETSTFVLLTVTLPLVSGACFSAGWRRLKDTHRYRQIGREIKKLEKSLETASSSYHSALSEVESAKTWLHLNADHSILDAETQQELNLYRHGYCRGINVPETIDHGLPLYDRVQRSAQKILAKRLKERMWSDVNLRI